MALINGKNDFVIVLGGGSSSDSETYTEQPNEYGTTVIIGGSLDGGTNSGDDSGGTNSGGGVGGNTPNPDVNEDIM